MLLKVLKNLLSFLPRRNPLGIIDIPVIFWSPVPSTHTLPATGDFPSGECSARWITPRAARGSRGARSKHTVWLNRSKKLGRSSPGGRGGTPPSLRRSSVSPRGVPGPRVGTPGGTPLPPGGRGGCRPEFCLTTGRGGTPGGVPRGGLRDPKKGGPGGGPKVHKIFAKKKETNS